MKNLIPDVLMKFRILLYLSFISIVFHSCKKDKPDECIGPFCGSFDYFSIDSDPAWSRDGKYIAYVHSGQSMSEFGIYVVSSDGTGSKFVVPGATEPTWSSDGQWLAFSYSGGIWKQKLNGDSLTQLTSGGRNYFPSWSPDGKWIAYDSNVDSPRGSYNIWKMKADGSEKIRIAYDATNGEIRMPYWGANNIISHIRYVAEGTARPEIFLMNSEGGEIKRLTNDDIRDRYPKIFGSKVIVQKQSSGNPKLWLIDASNGKQTQLTATSTANYDWSPDGKRIVYTDARTVNGYLWIMNADGSNKRQLTF